MWPCSKLSFFPFLYMAGHRTFTAHEELSSPMVLCDRHETTGCEEKHKRKRVSFISRQCSCFTVSAHVTDGSLFLLWLLFVVKVKEKNSHDVVCTGCMMVLV